MYYMIYYTLRESTICYSGFEDCLVLSREWGNGDFFVGDYIGTTIGILSPIPY